MGAPCVPRRVRVHPRMQDGEERAHGSSKGDFLCVPSCQQPVGEGCDHRVTPRGRERGPRQDGADLRAAPADMPRAGPLAALVIEGGDADQLGHCALVEDASLRQGRLQGGGQHGSNAWRGLSHVIRLTPGRARADARGDLLLRLMDQALEVVKVS